MTAIPQPRGLRREPPPEGGPVILRGISWSTYEDLVDQLVRSKQRVYLTYDRGVLEIMSPSLFHERFKRLLGTLIDILRLELRIPVVALGSTTQKRVDLARGLEPDECYYVQHAPQMMARWELDLATDPPPDLAIEVDYTHHEIDREDVYAALGVPELWQFDGQSLRALLRGVDGAYHPTEVGAAFPFLRIADVDRFLKLARDDEERAIHAFRDWVRTTHGPGGATPR